MMFACFYCKDTVDLVHGYLSLLLLLLRNAMHSNFILLYLWTTLVDCVSTLQGVATLFGLKIKHKKTPHQFGLSSISCVEL